MAKANTHLGRCAVAVNSASAIPTFVSALTGTDSALPNSNVHTPCDICDAPVPCDLCNSFGRDSIVAVFSGGEPMVSNGSSSDVTFFQELQIDELAAASPSAPTCAICGDMVDTCETCTEVEGGNIAAKIHSLPGFEHLLVKKYTSPKDTR